MLALTTRRPLRCAPAWGNALDTIANELHNEAQLSLTQQRLDRADGSQLAADLQPVADRERLLSAQMTGRDHLVAAPQLIAIVHPGHRPLGRYASGVTVSDVETFRVRFGRDDTIRRETASARQEYQGHWGEGVPVPEREIRVRTRTWRSR